MTTTEIRRRLTIVRQEQEQLELRPNDANANELSDQLTLLECKLEDALLDDGDVEFVDAFLDWIGSDPVVIDPAPYVSYEEEVSDE